MVSTGIQTINHDYFTVPHIADGSVTAHHASMDNHVLYPSARQRQRG